MSDETGGQEANADSTTYVLLHSKGGGRGSTCKKGTLPVSLEPGKIVQGKVTLRKDPPLPAFEAAGKSAVYPLRYVARLGLALRNRRPAGCQLVSDFACPLVDLWSPPLAFLSVSFRPMKREPVRETPST